MHRKGPAVLAAGTVLPARHLVSLRPSPLRLGKAGDRLDGAVPTDTHGGPYCPFPLGQLPRPPSCDSCWHRSRQRLFPRSTCNLKTAVVSSCAATGPTSYQNPAPPDLSQLPLL